MADHPDTAVEGAEARVAGAHASSCPYAPSTDKAREWLSGWEMQDKVEDSLRAREVRPETAAALRPVIHRVKE